VKLMEIKVGHETFGPRTNGHCTAAMVKPQRRHQRRRKFVEARSLAIQGSPQITPTVTARKRRRVSLLRP